MPFRTISFAFEGKSPLISCSRSVNLDTIGLNLALTAASNKSAVCKGRHRLRFRAAQGVRPDCNVRWRYLQRNNISIKKSRTCSLSHLHT